LRTIRYQEIAAAVRDRVAAGEYAPGRLLPSEADLSAEFDASRVTIRRALETLRDDGLIAARQGFGWFVASEPLRQTLGQLGTIEGQLAARGIVAERRIVEFAFGRATPTVRAVLGTDHVLRTKRVNMADGAPFAVVTVWCPAELAQSLSRRDVERSPFYELLGIPLRGASQTIGADLVTGEDATLLGVPSGSPVLVCVRTTTGTDGHPVLYSHHVFPAHRTEFVVDLPHVEPSIAPTGLRLLESS
jgi:GntR family transcriptional regulator